MKKTVFYPMLFSAMLPFCSFAREDIPLAEKFTAPNWNAVSGKAAPAANGKSLRLTANHKSPAVMLSRLFPASRNKIKIEVEVFGSGLGSFGFRAYDADSKPLPRFDEAARFSASSRKSEVRGVFDIAPDVKFIAIAVEASPNSDITVKEIDAEFTGSKRTMNAITIGNQAIVPLVNERHYKLADIPAIPFGVTIAAGTDIEFEFEEKELVKWQIKSASPDIFRVKIDHDRDGVWPVYFYDAEFEITALRPGRGELILLSPEGKTISIKVEVVKQ